MRWAVLLTALTASCRSAPVSPIDDVAKTYVLLTLALDARDPGYVESFYGPDEWKDQAAARFETTASIGFEASRLLRVLAELPDHERRPFLTAQLQSLLARADALRGAPSAFDEETRARYGGAVARRTESELAASLATLDGLLEGEGSLRERLARHERRYLVAGERLEEVFRAAIAACRQRTVEHLELPPSETWKLELVRGKPWAAYSWYRGGYESVIQLNAGFGLTLDAMIDLACHEVYPGHHTLQVLLESRVVRARDHWEYAVMPLYSPFAADAEGVAEVGVRLAFPPEARRRIEQEVLFPLAGIAVDDYDHYDAVRRAVRALRAAHIEAARGYIDGDLSRREAASWLEDYALVSDAESALRYLTIYRSQIASYAIGEARAQGAGTWRELERAVLDVGKLQ